VCNEIQSRKRGFQARIAPSPFNSTASSGNRNTMLKLRSAGDPAGSGNSRSRIAGGLSASNARASSLGSIILEVAS